MRFACFCACLTVFIDCLLRATGAMPSPITGPDFAWIWYIAAAMWAFVAARVLFRGAP
jgi:hypothetical protein